MTQISRVDFNTTCSNSSKLHIILSPVGHVNETFINNIPQELAKVPLPNSQQLIAKFVLQSAPLQSDWSDVQHYRRPIGLLCIAHIDDNHDSNVTNILPQYEKIKRRLDATVIDSRCIIFSRESLMLPPDCIRPDIMVIQYHGTAASVHCEELTAMIGEFTQALFSVLVRKTIEMSTEKYNSVQLLYSPYERSKSGLDEGKTGKRRIQGRHKKHLGDLYLMIGKPDKAAEAYEDALKILIAIGDSMWVGAAYEGQCCAIARIITWEDGEPRSQLRFSKVDRSSQDSLNSISSEPEPKSEENVIRLFKSALNSMEKIREASLIMLETTLKFIRLMIELENKREACEVINSDVWYSFEDLSAVERLQLYCTVATLYKDMEMTRKYCYFVRRAALESIQERMSRAYAISSSLLCNVIEKYGVVPGRKGAAIGWPRLQKLVLEDLIATSEKLANSDIVVKYGMCLLQNFYSHLNYDDQLRILNLIFKNNTRLGGHIVDISHVPICKKITVKQLGKSLTPISAKQSDSVFIFAPKTNKEKTQKSVVWWVCDEFGEVHLRLDNPLLHALQLFDISCVMKGGEVECYPATITIQPKQTIDIILSIKPCTPASLKLTGLQLQLCGVPCHIALDVATEIQVVHAMPLLTLRHNIPPTLTLFEGETTQFIYTLINNSTFSIDKLEVIEHRKSSIFQYDTIPVPLLPNHSTEFVVKIDTNITYNKRRELLQDDDRVSTGARRGTIYENRSSDENLDMLAQAATRCRRVKAPDQIFTEDMFHVSLRYFDNKNEFYRNTDIQFNTQVMLLYKLETYRISQHLLDSDKFKWNLNLTSICPVRMEVSLAGSPHHLDPGEQLSTVVELPKVEGPQGEPTVQHRVKYSDLLPEPCVQMQWVIGNQRGRVDLIESVDSNTGVELAFTESIRIRYKVGDGQVCEGRRSVTIGQPIDIAFTIENISNCDMESLLFYIQAFCDGTHTSKKVYPVPYIGCKELEIDKLVAHDSVLHHISLLPMNCGAFYLEVGVCTLPAAYTPSSVIVQCRNTRSQSALSIEDQFDDHNSPIIPRKIIIQNIDNGLPVPKYTKSWKMRPNLYFDVLMCG